MKTLSQIVLIMAICTPATAAKTDFQGSGQPQRARNLDLEECPLCSQGLHLQKSGIAEIFSQIRLVRTPSQVYSQKRLFEHRSL